MTRDRRRRDLADRLDDLESRADERGRGVVVSVAGHGTEAIVDDVLDDLSCPDCGDEFCIFCDLDVVDR